MAPHWKVYYDSWCPTCTRIQLSLRCLDWLNHLTFDSIRDADAARRLGVSLEALERRMHVLHLKNGRVAEGMEALVVLTAQIPLLWPLWPLCQLSVRCGFGHPLYDWIASLRRIVPIGHCQSSGCSLHTEQKGRSE
jgi:predicted DCC family thiol-disulfide oxidoreductase YuxK